MIEYIIGAIAGLGVQPYGLDAAYPDPGASISVFQFLY
jgi:hypothetical protein